MKKIMWLFFLLAWGWGLSAQVPVPTFSEWFRQQKTQVKYYLQQIAALQVYTDFLQKGYGIARDGLGLIHTIKEGDFDLHNGYFNSLLAVNPAIKKYGKVAGILVCQQDILQQFTGTIRSLKASGQLTAKEIGYASAVYVSVVESVEAMIRQLELLIRSGNYALSDDARMARIDQLDAEIQATYGFVNQFTSGTERLALQRWKDGQDGKQVEAMYDIKIP